MRLRTICACLGLLLASLAARAADAVSERFVFGLPKAELHVHLEGVMEPERYLAIAHRNGVATPYASAEAVRQRLRDAHDLPSFIAIYEELISAVQTEQDIYDIATDYFRRAQTQGVVHVEMFVDPQLHLERGMSLAALFAGLTRAQREAKARWGIDAKYILCFLRDRPADDAMRVLEQSRPWRTRFIGVGLDNPEVNDFPHKFQTVFARARALGLHLTTHCDVDQPNSVAHLWGALEVLGVERIDHGLNAAKDPALVAAVRSRGVGLTAAATQFYAEIPGRMEYRSGLIKQLLEQGVIVSVNSDDPGMMQSRYVGDLMLRVQQTAELSRDQVIRLAKNSFTMSWITRAQRSAYLASIDAYAKASPP